MMHFFSNDRKDREVKKCPPRLIHILWKLILKNDIIGIFDWSFFSVIMHQNVCGPIICNALFWIVKFFDFIILFKKSNLFLQHLWQKAEVGWKNCERRVGSFIKREPLLFLHNYLWENLNLILHVECEEGGYISPLVVNYLSALRYDNGVKWFLKIAIFDEVFQDIYEKEARICETWTWCSIKCGLLLLLVCAAVG